MADSEYDDDTTTWDADYPYDDTEIDYFQTPQSTPRRRVQDTDRRKLIRIGIIVLFGVLGTLGASTAAWQLWMMTPFNVVNMTYLPADTALVMRIRVASLLNAPMTRELIRKNPEAEQRLSSLPDELPFKPDDIESLTIGMSDQNVLGQGFPSLMSGRVPGLRAFRDSPVFVLRLHRDFELNEQNSGKAITYHGTTIYRSRSVTAWQPASRTIVFGDQPDIEKAIDKGHRAWRFSGFDFARSDGDILVAGILPKNSGSQTPSLPPLPPQFASLVTLAETLKAAQAISINVNVTTETNVAVRFSCQDRSTSERIVSDFKAAVGDGEKALAQIPVRAEAQAVIAAVRTLLSRITFESSGTSADVQFRLDQATLDSFTAVTGSR